MGHLIEALPPEQRITHYRAMACEAEYLANEAQIEEVRTQFLRLAQSWGALANEMGRNLIERERVPAFASQGWLSVS